jgi:hypothetical protein
VALVPELFELSVVAGLLPSAMPRQCAAEKACASLLDSSHRSRTAPHRPPPATVPDADTETLERGRATLAA